MGNKEYPHSDTIIICSIGLIMLAFLITAIATDKSGDKCRAAGGIMVKGYCVKEVKYD